MTEHQEEKLDNVLGKVQAIHTAVFGHEGQGGILRRQDEVEQRVKSIEGWRNKLIGIALAASTLTAYVAPKMTDAVVKFLYNSKTQP